jgi:hypothetical protein
MWESTKINQLRNEEIAQKMVVIIAIIVVVLGWLHRSSLQDEDAKVHQCINSAMKEIHSTTSASKTCT